MNKIAVSLGVAVCAVLNAFGHRSNTPVANSSDEAWSTRHAEKVAAVADASVKKDIVFIGDELTQGWETTGANALSTSFTGDKAMFNLGFSGDCTEHVLWRIQNGELGNPKAIFLMIGGNNTATYTETEEAPGKTFLGVKAIIDYIRNNHGATKLIVQAILPRGADESDPVRARNDFVNSDMRKYAQAQGCTWVDMTDLFLESDHHTLKTSLFEADKATLNAAGYSVWAGAVSGYVTAAVNGTAMPSDLVATARPAGVPVAAYPSFSTAVMENFFWEKYNYDVSCVGANDYDIVLLGDSITQKWQSTDPGSMNGLGTTVFNLGRSGDFTENLHWRLNAGCLDGYTTKFFNLLIGTNNSVQRSPMDDPADIAAGVKAVLDLVLEKHPESKVLLMPILPYGYTNVQNNATGTAVYANNEAANEIIKTYADGQRVILVDVRDQFLNADGTFKGEMYLERNGDYPDMFLHLSARGYSEIIAPAIKAAMTRAGASSVTLPQIGSVAAKTSGAAATITLSGIAKGTDKDGVAASSYKVGYKLDTAAETTLSASESGESATVAFSDLADGWHTCAAWVTSDGVVKSEVKRVKFQIDTNTGAIGWKVAPMTEDSAAIRNDGTKVFAVAKWGGTFNDVEFSARDNCSDGDNFSASPANSGRGGWGLGVNNALVNNYWEWSSGSGVTFSFKGLTKGRKYVAQIVAARPHAGGSTTVSAGDLTAFVVSDSNDYKYGAVITRVFEASAEQENIAVNFSSAPFEIKAVQLRDLGAGEEGGDGEEGGEGNEGGEGPGQESDPPAVTPAGSNYLSTPVPGSDSASAPCTAKERTDDYHKNHFAEDLSVVAKSHKNFDVVLFGDSITDFWVNPNLSLDGGLTNTVNMGIGSDRTQNLLWRVRNGALDGYTTKFLTLLIGVNNSHQKRIDENIPCDRPEDIADSIRLILNEMVAKHPESKILLMPIIPYCYDSRYYDGLEVWNTNEDVNDYIIKFVDNKRIFWVDFRRQFLNSDATCNHSWYRDGGNPGGGYDAVGTCLHPAIASYSEIFKPALTSAMQKYLALPAGAAQVAEPSLGYASAEPDGVANSATITVRGIFLGTDSSANPVTSYTLAYDLDNGAKTGVLTNQTLTRNSFTIPEVGSGDHTCTVTITTASGKVLTTSVDFAMTEGWTGAPLPADSSAVRTDGTLAYAYAIGNYTVNGVPFVRAYGAIGDNIDWPYPSDSSSPAPTGVEAGGYSDLLTHCWWANQGEKTVTLKNLTAGKKYLVQMFGYRNYSGFEKTHVWIKESFRDVNYIKILGEGWTYGGTLTGYFTASSSTKSFTIAADSNYAVNGIQVRMLGEGEIDPGPVNPPAPTIYNLTVPAKTGLALQSVTTNGIAVAAVGGVYPIVKGTAVKVTFSAAEGYEIVGNDYVTLTMNGTTTLTSYPTVNQKGGSGGGEGGGEEGGEETPPAPVAAGWTVTVPTSTEGLLCTTGTLVYAYAPEALTVGGISFTGDKTLSNTDFTVAQTNSGYDGNIGSGGQTGEWAKLMGQTWRWSNTLGAVDVTLNGLEAGNDYLVQFISHNGWSEVTVGGGDAQKQPNSGNLGASVVGVFTATASSQTVTVTFGGSAGWRTINAVQVRRLGTASDDPGPVNPPAPTVYNLTVPAKTGLALQSVTTNGVSVAAVGGVYPITENTSVTVTFAADEGYEIVSGNPVVFTVTADKTLADAEYPVVQETTSGGDVDPVVPPAADGWTSEPMDSVGAKFSTQGTLKCAYATQGVTINGVPFERVITLTESNGVLFSPAGYAFGGVFMNEGVSGDFGLLLGNGWYWKEDGVTSRTVTLTLKDLTVGRKYLVQVLSHTMWNNDLVVSAGGCTPQHVHGSDEASGKYGALLTGVFTASATTHAVSVLFANGGGEHPINAVQVRDLGEGGEAPVDPPEETIPVYTLTIPAQDHLSVESVKTNDVVVAGSGNAYSIVSNTQVTVTFAAETGYEITGGNPVVVTVESDMTLAEFPTVQKKQGGSDPVVPPGYELGWTAAAMTADPASVRKDGTLLYAYARVDATVNTVAFKGVGNTALAIDNDDLSWTGFTMTGGSGDFAGVTDSDYNMLLKSCWSCMQKYTHSVTLKNLTPGKTYLVQFIGCRSNGSNDAKIYVGETEDTSVFMKAGGDGWPYGGTLIGIFQADAATKVVDLKFTRNTQDWTSWNALQVRELDDVGPTPVDAPVIGGEGVDVPMSVSADKVAITISNAAVGHTYGYKKSVTLEGLATADVISFESPAAADGVLTLEIPKDPAEPSCFYQIVVE